jgi:hypothetical protein
LISISTHVSWRDPEHKSTVVQVGTHRCIYQVAIRGDEVTVVGPGVEETYRVGEADEEESVYIPRSLSREGQAAMAVLLFEESDL